jgi:hypothetical protein
MGGIFVVGIEDKLEEEQEEELEEELEEEPEMNIYEKMQNIIHEFNSKTFKFKPNEEMNKRIYTSSQPIPIPNKNK